MRKSFTKLSNSDRRSIIDRKLIRRSAVKTSTLLRAFMCRLVVGNPDTDARYFFGVADETFTGKVEPGCIRCFWLSEDGDLIAMTPPTDCKQQSKFEYEKKNGVGDASYANRLLDQLLIDFGNSREVTLAQRETLDPRLKLRHLSP